MGVWRDKLDGCASLRKCTKKSKQVSFLLLINFSSASPSIQVLSNEL